jgi:hypothetical protein
MDAKASDRTIKRVTSKAAEMGDALGRCEWLSIWPSTIMIRGPILSVASV